MQFRMFRGAMVGSMTDTRVNPGRSTSTLRERAGLWPRASVPSLISFLPRRS